uniref:Reverse transcriptase domain-containing protein n=1 Tax=Tanacetum cinerariifolium TaxID=118510 RepID=A0A6L2LE08_TANCI|nr:reverse transcriptase domain-containing protein [Tanacetum cinerariifolium]
MTSTLKYRDVPNDAIKLMLFPYSLEGAARIWYKKEPRNSILTWDDLVNKFVNQIFPPSKTTHLKNEISRFTQRFEETFGEAWERFKEMLRACPHHGFSELTQIDTFYNGLNTQDQDSLNAAAGGNLLSSFFQNQASTSGTLSSNTIPSNIIPNPKGEMKAVTTRSGLAYEGPSIPTNSSLEKVVERETEETTDCQGKASRKLGDPGKFLIPCDFPGMDVCHALADLGASINLIPLSIWKKLSLPELTPTQMTLELVNRSITHPKGVAEDVFVKVGKFYFPTDFVIIDFKADRRDDNSVNRIDVINIACDEFAQDVLDFKYNSNSGNPTLVSNPSLSEETKSEFCKEPIVKSSSPTLTPFGERDFFLEEIEYFLKDESIPTRIEDSCYDLEGDFLYLEKLLNDDLSQLPPMDLKQAEETKAKSSFEKPPELELKELPSHLKYAFLEETNKLPVNITKDLKDDEKEALLKVLKSHKRAIAWKIIDIKEANALPTNDARVFVKFLKSLFARFGTPRAIISDRGTHFCNDQFARVMTKYGVTHHLATAYHPQTSGQVEVSNRGLKRILKRTVGENRASWSDKLDDALWAFHTAFKTPIGCTPYKLVYEKLCHLPVKLEHKAYWALKHANFNLKTTERTKKLHDSKIKNCIFNVGDQVLLFNSRLNIFSKKLKTRWSGPFTITQVFPYGIVELSQPDGPNFKVNGHRVKHYFGGDIPSKVVPDLHTIPMDK